jgi:hypothetical protein
LYSTTRNENVCSAASLGRCGWTRPWGRTHPYGESEEEAVADRIKGEPEKSGALGNELVERQRELHRTAADRNPKGHAKDRQASQPGDRSLSELDGPEPRDSLTAGQRRVMIRLAGGEDLKSAATRERGHPERVRRWLDTPRFARAYLRERAQPVGHSVEVRDALDRIRGKVKG